MSLVRRSAAKYCECPFFDAAQMSRQLNQLHKNCFQAARSTNVQERIAAQKILICDFRTAVHRFNNAFYKCVKLSFYKVKLVYFVTPSQLTETEDFQ
jgi:hypothetical protein